MSMINLFKRSPELATGTERPTPRYEPQGESLEDILLDLARWGCPYVHCHRDGEWSVKVDANITPLGAKFEVRSEFSCKTPTQAALQCRERLLEAVKMIGGAQ